MGAHAVNSGSIVSCGIWHIQHVVAWLLCENSNRQPWGRHSCRAVVAGLRFVQARTGGTTSCPQWRLFMMLAQAAFNPNRMHHLTFNSAWEHLLTAASCIDVSEVPGTHVSFQSACDHPAPLAGQLLHLAPNMDPDIAIFLIRLEVEWSA